MINVCEIEVVFVGEVCFPVDPKDAPELLAALKMDLQDSSGLVLRYAGPFGGPLLELDKVWVLLQKPPKYTSRCGILTIIPKH